jgi:hypothetical protein
VAGDITLERGQKNRHFVGQAFLRPDELCQAPRGLDRQNYLKELHDKLVEMTDPTESVEDSREHLIEFIKEEVRKSYWNGYDAAKRKAKVPGVKK